MCVSSASFTQQVSSEHQRAGDLPPSAAAYLQRVRERRCFLSDNFVAEEIGGCPCWACSEQVTQDGTGRGRHRAQGVWPGWAEVCPVFIMKRPRETGLPKVTGEEFRLKEHL